MVRWRRWSVTELRPPESSRKHLNLSLLDTRPGTMSTPLRPHTQALNLMHSTPSDPGHSLESIATSAPLQIHLYLDVACASAWSISSVSSGLQHYRRLSATVAYSPAGPTIFISTSTSAPKLGRSFAIGHRAKSGSYLQRCGNSCHTVLLGIV